MLFVRHALPGERVVARVTEGTDGDRFLRADAITVLTNSPDRVAPRCPLSGPGRCGGCDWQHASLPAQRALKADVVREQLARLAGLDIEVSVEAVPGDDDGLAWRTRMQFAVSPSGQLGLRPHRSHDVLPVDTCPIAHPGVDATAVSQHLWPGVRSVDVVVPTGSAEVDQPALVIVQPAGARRPPLPAVDASVAVVDGRGALVRARGRSWVREGVTSRGWQRDFRVAGSGFWQVHPGAAATLVAAVLDALDPQPGDQVLDLYAGVGLFAAAIAERVAGPAADAPAAPEGAVLEGAVLEGVVLEGAVLAVEGDTRAVRDARRNLHDLPGVGITQGRVDRVLAATALSGLRADLVVLDPPRVGAGRMVMEQICALGPRAVAYVACDPAALARDVAYAAEHGYRLAGIRAYDLFPMTHHIECVATLVPTPTPTPTPPDVIT